MQKRRRRETWIGKFEYKGNGERKQRWQGRTETEGPGRAVTTYYYLNFAHNDDFHTEIPLSHFTGSHIVCMGSLY